MKAAFTFFLNLVAVGGAFAQGQSLPYYTGFDNAGEQAGWQEFRVGYLSPYSWSFGGGGFSAPTCLSHDYNVGGNPGDIVVDWFVSPPLDVTGAATVSLKIKTSGFSTPTADNCEIWFGQDDPDPASGNYVLIGTVSYMQPQYTWLDTSFNLPFTTDNGYLAIRYKTIGAAWMTYQVDNITVEHTVSIAENKTLAVQVYPSPFSNATTIRFGRPVENAALLVFNSVGQVVKEVHGISGESVSLTRDDLPAGLYFFKLSENDTVVAEDKLVIAD